MQKFFKRNNEDWKRRLPLEKKRRLTLFDHAFRMNDNKREKKILTQVYNHKGKSRGQR